ncbi:GMC family oxidoreductase, partial [Sphingosinicella soli]
KLALNINRSPRRGGVPFARRSGVPFGRRLTDIVDRRATGVLLRGKMGTRTVKADGEVILAAGAIQSPKLLQLSGIGPGELLRAFSIPVVVDSRDVGRNLREHRYLALQYRVTGNSLNQRFAGLGLLWSMFSYVAGSKGPMTHAAHEIGGFVKTRPGLKHSDAQIGIGLYSVTATPSGVALDKFPGITVLGYTTRPDSQGTLTIQSADPDIKPHIEANHFATEADRASALSLFRWLRAFPRQPALSRWIIEETKPGASIETDEDILANAVALGGTSFHICGTARMGSDAAAVLDPQLRVRGVGGLRVVDTSIMPTIVSGNTNAPAMAIGLRAADFILAKR